MAARLASSLAYVAGRYAITAAATVLAIKVASVIGREDGGGLAWRFALRGAQAAMDAYTDLLKTCIDRLADEPTTTIPPGRMPS